MLPSGWSRSTVGDACAIKNNLRFPINTETRSTIQGPYPYFGPTGILAHIDHYRIDEEFAVIGEDGDHFLKFRERPMTLHFQGKANVNNHAHVIGDSNRCSPKWFYYWFMHRDLTATLSRQGVGRYKLTKKGLAELEIWLPPKREQLQIAALLATWERAISTTQSLLANSLKQKKILAHQLLTGKRRLARFRTQQPCQSTPNGFLPSDWAYRQIQEIATELNTKLGDDAPHNVLSCTKHDGLVDSLTYFNKQVFSVDTSTYKVAPRNSFVYATNHIEEGSIGYQDLYDFGLVSPMYTVFRTKRDICDGYLYRLLKTEHYRQIFAAATNASVDRRGSLRWNEFKKLRVPAPSTDEQEAIAKVLSVAEREVDVLKFQLRSLREEKFALLAQLLTGKRRVRLPDAEEASAA